MWAKRWALGVVAGGLALALTGCAAGVHSIGGFRRLGAAPAANSGPVPLFFMSALYCPFCAAERWVLVDALSQFGTWSHLGPAHSTSGVDGFSAVPTYDFYDATYQSKYVAFTHRDVADAQGHPLQTLSAAEQAVVNRDDKTGHIPLVVVDGVYVETEPGYSPGLLAGKSFAQVTAALGTRQRYAEDIAHQGDVLTALICRADGGQPQSVCGTTVVTGLEAKIR